MRTRQRSLLFAPMERVFTDGWLLVHYPHPLSFDRPHSVLLSSTPHMRLRHLRARTRARPLLCSLALDSVAFASPLCGHCQVNVSPPPLPPSLSAYPCMVFTMYDERQPEYAARYAFTGIQRHPPTVRAPPFGFSSFPSHHLMVGVVCCLFSSFSFHAPFSVHRFHTYGRPSPPASHDHCGREGWLSFAFDSSFASCHFGNICSLSFPLLIYLTILRAYPDARSLVSR